MTGRHILGVIGVAAVAVVALLAFAWRPAIAPIAPPSPASFPRELVDTGERLASAGNCIDCHTAPGGTPTPAASRSTRKAGIFYSTNLTPDPETGIGAWSEAAFTRALREGVSRDGAHLFPVFPYVHYTLAHRRRHPRAVRLLHEPAAREGAEPAEYAVFPARRPAPAGALEDPVFHARPLPPGSSTATRDGIAAPISPRRWPPVRFAIPTATCSAPSRADILMPAPRSMAGMRRRSTSAPSPARWTEEAFFTFLRRGDSPPHGVALGPMRSVVRNLSWLSDNDLQAMATYFVSLNTPSGAALEPKIARALSPVPPTTDTQRAGHKLYMENCASCHGAPGSAPPVARSPLGLSEALWNPYRAYNLVLTILDGIDGSDGLPGNMPGFRDKLSDDDIEALAIYLRTSYTTLPIWGLLAERIKIARNDPVPLP